MGTYSPINREKEKLNLLPKTNTQLLKWKFTRWQSLLQMVLVTPERYTFAKPTEMVPRGIVSSSASQCSLPGNTDILNHRKQYRQLLNQHIHRVKLLEAFGLPVKKGQGRGAYFTSTSYSVDILCDLFNYMKHILILTPQFSEVLHPFQYKVSDILSTWMHT